MCIYLISLPYFIFSFAGILKTFTMRWSRWRASIILTLFNALVIKVSIIAAASQNFKISPKPCIVGGVDGTCMFVWECIKSEGTHLGMCMDGFMFGSCCAHNLNDNFILPSSTPFRPAYKPTNKYKPTKAPSKPNKPSASNNQGTFTIQRPNGSGTLVIRQPPKTKSTTTRKPLATSSSKNPLDNFNDSSNELSASASISASSEYTFLNFFKSLKLFELFLLPH